MDSPTYWCWEATHPLFLSFPTSIHWTLLGAGRQFEAPEVNETNVIKITLNEFIEVPINDEKQETPPPTRCIKQIRTMVVTE